MFYAWKAKFGGIDKSLFAIFPDFLFQKPRSLWARSCCQPERIGRPLSAHSVNSLHWSRLAGERTRRSPRRIGQMASAEDTAAGEASRLTLTLRTHPIAPVKRVVIARYADKTVTQANWSDG